MGGPNSGNWYRWQGKKTTVEECHALPVSEFRNCLRPYMAGTLTWRRNGGGGSSVDYRVSFDNGAPTVTLHYQLPGQPFIEVPLRLQKTAVHFGGFRWWFTCPLVVNGVACHRRVGKVYLPPGSRYFGCRTCHGLTYVSCQEAHQAERVFGRLGMEIGYDAEVGRLLAARFGKNR